jgi:hypothetical protein
MNNAPFGSRISTSRKGNKSVRPEPVETGIITITGPAVVCRAVHYGGTYRIEIDIALKTEQVSRSLELG